MSEDIQSVFAPSKNSSTLKKMKKPKVIHLKRKQLHSEKTKAIAQKHELQQILGAMKPPDDQEVQLEQLVLGGTFEEETDEDDISQETDTVAQKRKRHDDESVEVKKAPVWVDDDDENILVKDKAGSLNNCHRSISLRGNQKYSDYAQEKFTKLMGAPAWAELGKKDEDSDSEPDELLMKTRCLIKSSDHLPKHKILIRKCPSLVDTNMKNSIVKSVELNTVSKVALIAGTNETVNLFQIDGKVNAKIQSIHFEKFPVYSAHFTVDGTEIVAGSNMFAHFFSYDMLAGKIIRIPWQKGMEQRNIRRFHMSPDGKYIVIHGRYGNIHLMTAKSKEWVGSLKMNGEVIAVTFNKDGSKMYSHGTTGEIYIWDMSSRKCIHKFVDEGCIAGTSLAVSPNDQFLATGSDSGIVNIYDSKTVHSSVSPEPLKVLTNLTTEISQMKFNHSSELLAVSSSQKNGSIKLVHFPSMNIFSNFPNKDMQDSIKKVNSLDISPNSGFICIGNNMGSASILRLKHFNNY